MMFLHKWVLPPILVVFYWVWSHTWRFEVVEHPAFSEARRNGTPIIFAFWHGDEMALLRAYSHYRCAAMVSTSKDGELMARVLGAFGFKSSRGSSTRGGVRGMVGLIKLMKQGYHAAFAVDGPKGPRMKVKAGVIDLAKHSNGVIVPAGVARSKAYVFEKSWNKAYLPWPFARVTMSFGKPVENPNVERVEAALLAQSQEAQSILAKGTQSATLN